MQFNRNDFLFIARFLDLINYYGLVHGDISFRNIILSYGNPKIIDWEPSGRQIFGNRIIAKASFKTKIVKTLKGTIQLTADYFAFYNLLKSSFYFIPEMETIFEQSLDSCLKLSLYTLRLEENYKSEFLNYGNSD